MEKTVSTRQFAIIIFIVAVSSKIFMLPALLMGISGRDSWLTLLAYYAVELLVFACILTIFKHNPDKTIYQLLESAAGKIFSKIILLFIIIFYLFKTTVMISEIKVFFSITATESLNWQLCIIPLLITFGIISLRSLRGIGRISEILTPLILIAFVILAIIMAKNIDFTNIFPVFEKGFKGNVNSFLLLPVWLTDFSVLTIFFGKVKIEKKFAKRSLIACGMAFLIALYFNMVMFSTYSYAPNLLDYGHNVTNMLLYPLGTYNYGRIDLVLFSIWMLGIIIHIALIFYTICRHFSEMSKIKSKYSSAIIIIITLFIFIEILFPDELKLYSYSISSFNYYAFIIELFFPFMLLMATLNQKRKLFKRKSLLKDNINF